MRTIRVALLGFTLLAINALAQDIEFTLDRENFSFGREVLLRHPFSCDTRFIAAGEVEDNGAGQIAFTVTERGSPFPSVGCVPQPEQFFNVSNVFELTPGDYTLTIRQDGGDQQFTFTVRDSVFDSGLAQTGSWFDPAQAGHGLNLEFFPDGRVIAYWYAYDDDGDNLWLLGRGRYDGDQAVFEVFEAEGDGFPPNYDPDSHDLDAWGEMTISFDSCSAGTLRWTTTAAGFQDGEMPLQRLSPPNGQACLDDDREADAWNTVNLLADELGLGFDLLNASEDGSGGGETWTVAFEDLPEALGDGRALAARPGAVEGFSSFYLGTIVLGSVDRLAFGDGTAPPPYSVLAELTLALPGALACEQLTGLDLAVSFMNGPWQAATDNIPPQPLVDLLGIEHRLALLGGIDAVRQDDCSTVDEYLVRSFVSPAVLTEFTASYATLTVGLAGDAPGQALEGPVYLLDFRLRGRAASD